MLTKTDVGPCWKPTDDKEGSDANGRPEYRDVFAPMQLGPRESGVRFRSKAWTRGNPITKAQEQMVRALYDTRWLHHNKDDAGRPEYRSRLVVQETRRSSTIPPDGVAGTASSTQPLEVVRPICSLAMSMPGMVLQFLPGWTHCNPWDSSGVDMVPRRKTSFRFSRSEMTSKKQDFSQEACSPSVTHVVLRAQRSHKRAIRILWACC